MLIIIIFDLIHIKVIILIDIWIYISAELL